MSFFVYRTRRGFPDRDKSFCLEHANARPEEQAVAARYGTTIRYRSPYHRLTLYAEHIRFHHHAAQFFQPCPRLP
jgi:hypothetical protein